MQRHMLKPPQYAHDWFSPLRSDEVVVGRVTNFMFMGHELIAFRDENQQVVVLDAHCPHFGGHRGYPLAQGSNVMDGCVRCPFHGLHFDKTGQCVKGDFVDDHKSLRHIKSTPWTVREAAASIFVWHGKDRQKPSRALVFEDFDFDEWTPMLTNAGRTLAPTNLFFPTENIVDVQHFYAVHNWKLNDTLQPPGITPEGTFRAILDIKWAAFAQSKHATLRTLGSIFGASHIFDITIWGPGIAISQSTVAVLGGAKVLSIILIMPINETDCQIRVVSAVSKSYAGKANRVLKRVTGKRVEEFMARAFLWIAVKDFDGDEIIWTHRKYLSNPKPLKEDGPLIAFRKWSLRFWPDDYGVASPTQQPGERRALDGR